MTILERFCISPATYFRSWWELKPMYPELLQVTFNIPDEVASQLLAADEDASKSALEAFAVEGHRSGRFTKFEVRRMLGDETRMEVHTLLAAHDVCLQYRAGHLQQDIAASDRLRHSNLASR